MGLVTATLTADATPAVTVRTALVAEWTTVGYSTGSFTSADGDTIWWGTTPGASNSSGADFTMFLRERDAGTSLWIWGAETFDGVSEMDDFTMANLAANWPLASDGTTGEPARDMAASMAGFFLGGSLSSASIIWAREVTWNTVSDVAVARVEFDYTWFWSSAAGTIAGASFYIGLDPSASASAWTVFDRDSSAYTRLYRTASASDAGGLFFDPAPGPMVQLAYGNTNFDVTWPDAWAITRRWLRVQDEIGSTDLAIGFCDWFSSARTDVPLTQGEVLTFDGDDLLVIQTTTSSVFLARLTG